MSSLHVLSWTHLYLFLFLVGLSPKLFRRGFKYEFMYSWESPPQRLRCEPTMYFKLTYQHSHPGIQNAFLSILDVTEASNSQKESHIWGCKMQNFLHFATIRFTKRVAHYYFILPPIILISQKEQSMGCRVYWSLHFYACSCFQLPW